MIFENRVPYQLFEDDDYCSCIQSSCIEGELSERYISTHQTKSECRMVKSGVPQGTVLDPLFFLFNITDIDSSSVRLFADDGALYIPIYSEGDFLSLQVDILKL